MVRVLLEYTNVLGWELLMIGVFIVGLVLGCCLCPMHALAMFTLYLHVYILPAQENWYPLRHRQNDAATRNRQLNEYGHR